jgi:hypothetical protein
LFYRTNPYLLKLFLFGLQWMIHKCKHLRSTSITLRSVWVICLLDDKRWFFLINLSKILLLLCLLLDMILKSLSLLQLLIWTISLWNHVSFIPVAIFFCHHHGWLCVGELVWRAESFMNSRMYQFWQIDKGSNKF